MNQIYPKAPVAHNVLRRGRASDATSLSPFGTRSQTWRQFQNRSDLQMIGMKTIRCSPRASRQTLEYITELGLGSLLKKNAPLTRHTFRRWPWPSWNAST